MQREDNTNLRELTGLDKEVDAFLARDEVASRLLVQLQKMFKLMISRIKAEGRPNFTLAFGCTGGKHRSVWAAAKMAKWIEGQGHPVHLYHREFKEGVF